MTPRIRSEDGTASVVLPLVLWLGAMCAIVLVDVGAYLVAASRAQSLADAAALAAVSADATLRPAGGPAQEAARVVDAGNGRLEGCDCRPGQGSATVTVSVEVPGLVVPRLGVGPVAAEASAVLVPADPPPPATPDEDADPAGQPSRSR